MSGEPKTDLVDKLTSILHEWREHDDRVRWVRRQCADQIEAVMQSQQINPCDHKFLGTGHCVKCGWRPGGVETPPAGMTEVEPGLYTVHQSSSVYRGGVEPPAQEPLQKLSREELIVLVGCMQSVIDGLRSARSSPPPERPHELVEAIDVLRAMTKDDCLPDAEYCWWCHADINGKYDAPDPHDADCLYVRAQNLIAAVPPPVTEPPVCSGCNEPMQRVDYRCGSCGTFVAPSAPYGAAKESA